MKDMKSILLAVGCWLLGATAGLAQSDPGPWDGSISSTLTVDGNTKTIYIYTPADLAAIHDKWSDFPEDGHHGYEGYTIKLMNDLDMNGQNGRNFQPLTIGWTDSHRFGGVFDGQGHTIKNLWIDGEEDGRALFGWICGGDILNLKLENPIVRAGDDDGNGYVGALCGKMENHSVISHCAVIGGRVEGWNWNDDDCIGAICGWADNDKSQIDHCYVVNTEVCGHKQVGGIIGKIENNDDDDNVPVSNCYFAGTIRHNGDEYFAAIVGERYGNPLSNNFYLNRNDGVKGTGNQSKYNGSSDDPNACGITAEALKAPLLFGANNTEWVYPMDGYPELKVFLRYNEGDTFYEKRIGYKGSNTNDAVSGYLKVMKEGNSPYKVSLERTLTGAANADVTINGVFNPYFDDSKQLKIAGLSTNSLAGLGAVNTVTLPTTLETISNPLRHQVKNAFRLPDACAGCKVKDGGLYDVIRSYLITAPKTFQTLTIHQELASTIADYAFEGMSNLKTIYVNTFVPAGTLVDNSTNPAPLIRLDGANENIFSGCPADLDIYIKDGTANKLFIGHQGPGSGGYGYSNADGWKNFYYEYEDLPNHMFSYFPVNRHPGRMSTLMLAYPVMLPEGVSAWWATLLTNDNSKPVVHLQKLDTKLIPALTPVLLTYEATTEPLFLSRYEGSTSGSAIDYEDNLFRGSVDPGGHTMTSSEMMSNFYTLGRRAGDNSYDSLGFYRYNPKNNVLPSYVAWIASNDLPADARWTIDFDEEATGIEGFCRMASLTGEQQVYTMQGVRIDASAMQKGTMYIVNGKKLIMR